MYSNQISGRAPPPFLEPMKWMGSCIHHHAHYSAFKSTFDIWLLVQRNISVRVTVQITGLFRVRDEQLQGSSAFSADSPWYIIQTSRCPQALLEQGRLFVGVTGISRHQTQSTTSCSFPEKGRNTQIVVYCKQAPVWRVGSFLSIAPELFIWPSIQAIH